MKADEETLVLGRVSRMLEQMEDTKAQARIATYIYHRFTIAGDQILPVDDQVTVSYHDSRQLPLPNVPAAPRAPVEKAGTGATRPATTAGQETAQAGPQSGTTEPVNAGGWNLSSNGSENDDEPTEEPKPKRPKGARAEPSKAPKVTAVDGGWEIGPDEEIEVKI